MKKIVTSQLIYTHVLISIGKHAVPYIPHLGIFCNP